MKPAKLPFGLLLFGPYGIYLVLFLVIPFANISLLSVYTYSSSQIAVPNLTLANFARLVEPYYLQLFGRTIGFGLVTTAICAVLGLPVAYYLARASRNVMTVGMLLLMTPLMISTVIRVFGWVVILGREGLINQVLTLLGVDGGIDILYTKTAVVIGLVQLYLPFMVLPVMAAIERIPRNLEEAAQNLGASWGQTFLRTVLPLSLPGLLSGCVLVYGLSISAYVTPTLMGGSGGRMVGQQIYDQVLVSYNWPGAAAASLVLIALTVIVTAGSVALAPKHARGARR